MFSEPYRVAGSINMFILGRKKKRANYTYVPASIKQCRYAMDVPQLTKALCSPTQQMSAITHSATVGSKMKLSATL